MRTESPVRPTLFLDYPVVPPLEGVQVTLACETFQVTGSFKFRAAYNVASRVASKHIIAASSGNFGQALACACKLTGKRCTIVMPASSARVKIEAVRSYGAEVDLIDTTLVSRGERVAQLAEQHPDAYIASAYDDDLVIEGNSTLGMEIGRWRPGFDLVVTPVGGGGIASGIIVGLRHCGSDIPVTGAEPLAANDAAESLRRGCIVRNEREPDTIADGARTLSLGRRNWAILKESLAGIVEVPEEVIREAVRCLFRNANLKAEPTGALALGAILTEPDRFRGKHVCCVVSGGNVDSEVYASILLS